MSRIDLQELAQRESEQVEWKDQVADVFQVVETVVAFANDYSNLGGGYVVCGVQEGKDEQGFQRLTITGLTSRELKEIEGRVTSICLNQVDPPLVPVVEELDCEQPDRRVLVFVVPATGYAHSYRRKDEGGRYFIRVSRETREARNGLLRELLVRKRALEPWDRRIVSEIGVEGIDLLALRNTLQRMNLWDENKGVEHYLSDTRQLYAMIPPLCVKEPLTGKTRPRHFSMLLFGNDVQKFCPGAYVIFSIYPGDGRDEPYSERKEIFGNILEQIRDLLQRLNMESQSVMDKSSGDSPNIVKYPMRALQEAVINALVHRDYESPQPIRITLFANRIEIHSPGPLPSAVSKERFLSGTATPYWRNQTLAWFFTKLHLAQAEGQGIATILRIMRDEGCPNPLFELGEESVTCILPAHPRHALMRQLMEVEQALATADFTRAEDLLNALLVRDPFNFRAINLFCEMERLTSYPGKVLGFVRRYEDQMERFNAHAQMLLGELLVTMPEQDDRMRGYSKRLLALAAMGQFQEAEVRRLVIALRRTGESQEAIHYIDKMLSLHPAWRESHALLQLRAKSYIDLAKLCTQTAKNQEASFHFRSRSLEQCRRFLALANVDLDNALKYVTDPIQREWIKKDKNFLKTMQKVCAKPQRVNHP